MIFRIIQRGLPGYEYEFSNRGEWGARHFKNRHGVPTPRAGTPEPENWRISPEEDEELYGLQQQPEGRWRDHQEEEAKRSKEERLDRKKKARD